MKYRRSSLFALIGTALLAAIAALTLCGCKAKAPTTSEVRFSAAPVMLQAGKESAEKPQSATEPARKAVSLEALEASRKLIRTGDLSVEVANYEQAAEHAAAIARAHGGYVADSRVARGAGDKLRGTLTIRVRADQFQEAFQALKALGKVQSESITAQDITKAYSDLETRLRVKREAEGRMREILRTKTAKLSEVVEAERVLTRLIEEIEQMEGERRYYDQQVALSTISAELHEHESIVHESAFAPIREAVQGSLQVLSTSVAAFIYAIVFGIPWILLVILLWRLRRRARARRLTKTEKV